jgi:serine/threonine protein kinase
VSVDETLAAGSPGTPGGAVADIDEKVLAEAVRRGLITPVQGSAAREEARSRGVSLLGVLRQRGLIDEAAAADLDEETKEDFVPGYRVLSKLGEGGMGVVYRALQKRLDREVALKVVVPRLAADPSYLKRFEREARAVAKLNHPSIVAAYDYGESNGRVFLAMEFVDGVNLSDWVRKNGPMGEDRALAITRDVASGLAHAHAAGIIHRDIKPGNVLLASRRPGETSGMTASGAKVTDLGLARMGNQAGGTELTAAGSILGTPGYMPPEQAFGREVDHRADIYALGATLYQLVTAHRPFEAPTPVAVIARQQSDRLPDPRDLVGGISPALPALLQGMLSREATTRYPSWKVLLADIDLARAGRMPTLPLPPESDRSLAGPTGAVPAAGPPADAPMAATLSTPSLGRDVPKTAAYPPPAPPPATVVAAPAKSSKAPLLIGGLLLAGGAAVLAILAPWKQKEAPPQDPGRSATPLPEDDDEKEMAPDLPVADARTAFSRIAAASRKHGGARSGKAQRLRAQLDRARTVMEGRGEALLREGKYGEALELARWVRAESGEAPAPGLDRLIAKLEGIGDRGPAERAAVAAAREARTRNDPVAILDLLDGFGSRYEFSPDLDAMNALRAWAEAEAPLVTVESDPKGALLLVAEKAAGTTPRSFRAAYGSELVVELRLDGYETERTSLWVRRDAALKFPITLRAAKPKDPVPAVLLVPDGDPLPLWTGNVSAWSAAGGEWNRSDPKRTAVLGGKEQPEPAGKLKGKAADLGLTRYDLARRVEGAPGWRLEWQMTGESRRTGTVLVEMQFAVLESGTALVLGIDDQGAYLGSRDGASQALDRTRTLKDAAAGEPHTFAVELHGDVFVATVDRKPLGAVAAPPGVVAARTIRAGVQGGAGYFSDIFLTRLRKP